jgi:hypothetical protein
MFKPNRRQIMFAAIGTVSVLAVRQAFLLYCETVSRNTPNFFASLRGQGILSAARTVGQQVRAQHPAFGTQVALAQFYSERPLLVAAHDETCLDTRRAMLQRQCREDFAAGHMVVVDGWLVSETEAQLCATIA